MPLNTLSTNEYSRIANKKLNFSDADCEQSWLKF